jgi:hypothetical protein
MGRNHDQQFDKCRKWIDQIIEEVEVSVNNNEILAPHANRR